MERGKLISFEGIDASGKSTCAENLLKYFASKGKESIITHEPAYESPTGKLIYDILHSDGKVDNFSFQLLYSVDRAFHVNNVVEPALSKGKNVIADRYFISTLAYAMATGVKGEQFETLKKVNSMFPYPDFIFLIDIDPQESSRRMMFTKTSELKSVDRFEKKTEFLDKVRKAYHAIMKDYKNSHIIEGNRDVADVFKNVTEVIEGRL